MWPQWAHFDLTHGSEAFAYACKTLEGSTSSEPTDDEAELTQIVLTRATAADSKEVMKSVCHVAVAWKDSSLWFKAVESCDLERSIATLGKSNICRAMETFGQQEILPWYEAHFRGTRSPTLTDVVCRYPRTV